MGNNSKFVTNFFLEQHNPKIPWDLGPKSEPKINVMIVIQRFANSSVSDDWTIFEYKRRDICSLKSVLSKWELHWDFYVQSLLELTIFVKCKIFGTILWAMIFLSHPVMTWMFPRLQIFICLQYHDSRTLYKKCIHAYFFHMAMKKNTMSLNKLARSGISFMFYVSNVVIAAFL